MLWSWSMIYYWLSPYDWRSGTSDGLFLPIYPPRGMRSSTLLQGLINFCNKYEFFMTNVSPWIIRTLTFSQLASLYGTVHCPFSHRDVVQTSQVHPNPVIWYALSHISLLYLPQNSHHTYLLWIFHGHSEIYCHATSTTSVLMTWAFIVILLWMII